MFVLFDLIFQRAVEMERLPFFSKRNELMRAFLTLWIAACCSTSATL
jgi:hypothetical protein